VPSADPGQLRRWMPSFAIRERSVLGLSPRISAAPGPASRFHLQASTIDDVIALQVDEREAHEKDRQFVSSPPISKAPLPQGVNAVGRRAIGRAAIGKEQS